MPKDEEDERQVVKEKAFWKLHALMEQRSLPRGNRIDLPRLSELPELAVVAFAGRCARRMILLLPSYYSSVSDKEMAIAEQCVDMVERFAANALPEEGTALHKLVDATYRATDALISRLTSEGEDAAAEAANTMYAAGRCAARVAGRWAQTTDFEPRDAAMEAHNSAYLATFIWAGERIGGPHLGMEDDFELLIACTKSETWTDFTPITPSFFAIHRPFSVREKLESGTIREITTGVDAGLNDRFLDFPRELFELQIHDFLSLMKMVLEPHGFVIELLLASADQRTRLIGLNHTTDNHRFLLELRRHAPGGKDAIVAVNRLFGVDNRGGKHFLKFSTAHLLRNLSPFFLDEPPGAIRRFELLEDGLGVLQKWLQRCEAADLIYVS